MAKFEKGNQAAAKGRKVEKMIERALLQDDDRRLRLGIEKILDKAADGELSALNFIADRLDGKPRQAVELGDNPENPLTLGLKVTFTNGKPD